jgi:hypothetical protein
MRGEFGIDHSLREQRFVDNTTYCALRDRVFVFKGTE